MASSDITLEAVPAASDIKAEDWDACANPRPDPDAIENLDTLASPIERSDSIADPKPREMDAAEVRDFLNHLWPAPDVRNICRWCCRAVRSPVCWRAWKARSS